MSHASWITRGSANLATGLYDVGEDRLARPEKGSSLLQAVT